MADVMHAGCRRQETKELPKLTKVLKILCFNQVAVCRPEVTYADPPSSSRRAALPCSPPKAQP